MKIGYVKNINEYGESLLRLYNFDKRQSIQFRDMLLEVVVNRQQKLDLSTVDFIEEGDVNLVLGLFRTDEGILTRDYKNFICALTLDGFQNMLELLEPFCHKETKAYQYLYDIDNPIDFLFSPAGS